MSQFGKIVKSALFEGKLLVGFKLNSSKEN